MTTEERTSRLEGAYEQVADRLNDMSLDIRDLRSESRKQFYWTIGLIITLLAAVIIDILMRA